MTVAENAQSANEANDETNEDANNASPDQVADGETAVADANDNDAQGSGTAANAAKPGFGPDGFNQMQMMMAMQNNMANGFGAFPMMGELREPMPCYTLLLDMC